VVQRFDPKDRSLDTIHELVRRSINSWLREPASVPSNLAGRLIDIGGGYEASFQRIEQGDLGEALRWKLVTGESPYLYRTTLTVYVAKSSLSSSWIWHDVETDRYNARFAPPRLTKLLTLDLETAPRDRISGFTEGLRKVEPDDLGAFLDEVLNNEDRVVPAFVSGSRNWSTDEEEKVEHALAPLHGIGTFWKLAPDAFDEFNTLVKPGYAVYPGSIHSFQSGLDTEDEQDSRRHWWFSTSEVRQSHHRDLSRRLHTEAMQSIIHVPLPSELLGLNQLFDQAITRRLFAQFEATSDELPAPPAEPQLFLPESQDTVPAAGPPTRPVPRPTPSATRIPPVRPPQEEQFPGAPSIPFEKPTSPAHETSQTQPDSTHHLDKFGAPVDATWTFEFEQLITKTAEEFRAQVPVKGSPLQRLKALFGDIRERLLSARRVDIDTESLKQIQDQFVALQREKLELQTDVDELSSLLDLADKEAEEQSDIVESQRAIAAREAHRATHLANELARVQLLQGSDVSWETPEVATGAGPMSLPAPTSVDDLFEQMGLLSKVVFTGPRKTAERITDLKLRELILRDVWRFSCELERYALCKETSTGAVNLTGYVESHTTQIAPKEFAAGESKSVQGTAKYRQPRELPVPTTLDSSGKAFMGAHFRLTQDNGKAMRMHLLDATNDDGMVYIGYIGPHLPSRRTS
jgi:hypothetical protein